ncbi:MAG: ATP-binding cassette domain-containing protein [Verrucomicrobia bacterium]|nr:ATP-binding cassette domain-containing protein [Verrucomicrobiota bacterium]
MVQDSKGAERAIAAFRSSAVGGRPALLLNTPAKRCICSMENSKLKPLTFWQDLRLAWSFHAFFLPFLLPAACLLLLALAQANLLYGSTAAGQRIIDTLSSHWSGAGSAMSAPTRILGFTLQIQSPFALAILMAILLLLAAVLGIGTEQLRIGLSQKFRLRIQTELLQALTGESGETRVQRQTGEMTKTFMTDAAGLSALLIFGVLGVFENGVKGVTYAIGLWNIPDGWKILVIIVPVAIVFQTLVNRVFSGAERTANVQSDTVNRQASARIVRFFELVGRLVYFGGEQQESAEILRLSREAGKANRRFSLISSARGATAGIVTSLSLPLIVMVLVQGVVPVTPGSIVQAQSLLGLLLMSISTLAAAPLMIAGSSPGMRQIRKVLDIPKPGPRPAELPEVTSRPGPASLSVKNVTFSYSGGSKPVLRGLSFDIPAGAVVGLTGRSGCGKSTLGKLLNGDLIPGAGSICVDETDITGWHLIWKRELVGYLPTGFEFLDGTLEENILIGRSRSRIDHFDEALRLSGVAKFLEEDGITLQHSIRSLSGEGYLSFGQRRRVGIAQLLCGKQRLLVLDEPGSSLDPETMLTIAANLREAVRGRTTLLITHDPDVFVTDFNLFIKNGVIADIGPHEVLMMRNQDYFDLLNKNRKERSERARKA